MSEIPVPSEEFTLERRKPLEQVSAGDVLPNAAEFNDMINFALDEGAINVFPVENAREADCTIEAVSVLLEESDFDGTGINFDELPTYIPSSKAKELGTSSKDGVAKKEALAVKEQAQEFVVDSQGWFLGNMLIAQEVESGSITQTFKIDLGDGKHIDLVNFSDTPVTDEHLAQLNDSVVRMFNATGGTIVDAVSGIAILPEGRFEGKNLAGAHIKSHSITLSEVLINDAKMAAMQERFGVQEHNTLGAISSFQATTTHEMMHLVEGRLSDYSDNNYRQRMGWVSEQQAFVDDYGNVLSKQLNRYDVPDRTQYVKAEDGTTQTVDVVEHFGRETYVTATPVSLYGHTDGREDLAEASVAYFYGAELDPVRRNAIDNIFDEVKGEDPPVQEVNIENIAPRDFKKGIQINPSDLGVMISYRKATLPAQSNATSEAYRSTDSRIGVVDDYGNLIQRTKKMQPVTR